MLQIDPAAVRVLATGLRFPEGPAVDADGSVLVPEIDSGRVIRVRMDGTSEMVAECGGGANGLAFGPDGALYVCNDGGLAFAEADGLRFPTGRRADKPRGSLQRVDTATGVVTTVFDEYDGIPFGTLNDIVFDGDGGCYFVETSNGVVFYADVIGGELRPVADGLGFPNGAGLSPAGDVLYVSETFAGRIQRWPVLGAGRLGEREEFFVDDSLVFDGLAIDGAGNVCVANQRRSGVTVIAPDGRIVAALVTPQDDSYVTNLCFGGPDGRTAYVCSGGRGILYAVDWPWSGLRLAFQP